jgi:hypothetical protein
VRSSRNIAAVQPSLYEADYYAWLEQQIRALREGHPEDLDSLNVAEKLDDLSQSVRRELQSRLELILSHLLKWIYQAEKRTPSWENTIDEQRARVADLLMKNPSLRRELEDVVTEAYRYARRAAGNDMGLGLREWRRRFPSEAPWSAAEILNASFLPKNLARR